MAGIVIEGRLVTLRMENFTSAYSAVRFCRPPWNGPTIYPTTYNERATTVKIP
jgi:hypothetical protein